MTCGNDQPRYIKCRRKRDPTPYYVRPAIDPAILSYAGHTLAIRHPPIFDVHADLVDVDVAVESGRWKKECSISSSLLIFVVNPPK
jgi:hypothetical protein